MNLLEVRDLRTYFYTYAGVVQALDGVTFNMKKGETLALVGETGCGKSVTALSVMRLIQWPPGRIVEGRVDFDGEDVLSLPEDEMRKIRGAKVSMIFQEPMSSLNPVYSIGDQISETIILHQGLTKKEALENVGESLRLVGMPDPEDSVKKYPHELSGGMQQRAMIAMALSCNPALLIADEPTTALDVTIEAQILRLMKELKRKIGAAIMLITHDLGIVAEMCDNVAIMYAGNIVEYADLKTIFKKPTHPYTQGLLESIPRMRKKGEKLYIIPGTVPNLIYPPTGCRFHPRCPHAMPVCSERKPPLLPTERGHEVACFLYGGV